MSDRKIPSEDVKAASPREVPQTSTAVVLQKDDGAAKKKKQEEDVPEDDHAGSDDLGHDTASRSSGPLDPDAPKSIFSPANLKVASVNAIGGTLNGYSVGYVGVYSTIYGMSSNCANYRGDVACETIPNADCKWFDSPSGGYCGWPAITCRVEYPNNGTAASESIARGNCLADSRCTWSYSASECQNPYGYSTSNNGIFAGSMILGCMLGSFFAGPLATSIGPKLSFLLIGIVSLVSSIMYHVSAAEDEFWVLIVGRFVIGLFLGVVSVACPMYVDQNGHPKYKRMIGVMYQVFTTLGIFLASVMGLALGQSIWLSQNKNQMVMARMQGLAAVSTLLSIAMIILGISVTEANNDYEDDDDIAEGGEAKNRKKAPKLKQYGWLEMIPRLLMGCVMAGTLQLTGINAVMNYAPTIMGSLGVAPLVGNFVVMVWNFVTTIASIPLASIFSMRQLFLTGSIFTSCMCMFLCGIPVYPGIAAKDAKNGVAITGILLFIGGYECLVGPCYYVLTQDMFPPSFRPKGASFTQVVQFIFNVIINVCYPIATQDISGGPSGNQDKGQSIAFIFFGGLGAICFILQVFFLFPWDDEKDGEKSISESAADARDLDVTDATGNRAEES